MVQKHMNPKWSTKKHIIKIVAKIANKKRLLLIKSSREKQLVMYKGEASLVVQLVKNLPAMQGRPGFNPWFGNIPWRWERLPTSVFWPGESPWTEEPDRLQLMGSQRVRQDWVTKHSTAKYNGQGNSCKTIIWLFSRNFADQKTGMLYANWLKEVQFNMMK